MVTKGQWTFIPPKFSSGLLFFSVLIIEVITYHFMGTDSPVWVTNAIGVSILLRNDPAAWPKLLLLIVLADTSASLLFGTGFTIGAGSGVCDAFEVGAVSYTLRLISRKEHIFSSLGSISRFAAVVVSVPAFSAGGGAILLHLAIKAPYGVTWRAWYFTAMFGLLIVTPFLLLWTEPGRIGAVSRWGRMEIALLTVFVGVVGWINFTEPALPGLFLSFPVLLLAAFRGGLLGATSAAIALVVVATYLTMTGHGEIAKYPGATLPERILLLQFYFAAVILSSLPVAVTLEQRKLLSQFQTVSELFRMARHDSLTGLPNRLLFRERLSWIQAEARQQGSLTALLMVDLDRFKPVNDLHGHSVGDRLLVMVADRLRGVTRANEILARLGGDEFALAGEVISADVACDLARGIIAAISEPFSFMDLTIEIGCSVGIVLSPADGSEVELMIERADSALYEAKREGRNLFRFFELGMDDAVRRRAEMEVELRRALALDQVLPHFQPIVLLSDDKIVGFEMLARRRHLTLGDIPPSVFIPLAEALGLIPVLFERLTRQACKVALTWPEHVFLSVNVSPLQLRDSSLPALVRSILAETGLSALRFEIELTESALIDDYHRAHDILVSLKTMGIRLALDDFGTGYSSLRHLQGLPLDKIKIDKGFVGTMMTVSASRKIVAGVVGLAQSLGLPVVAEGIENPESAAALNLLGCDLGQGWLYGRAASADEVAVMLELVHQHYPGDAQEVTVEG